MFTVDYPVKISHSEYLDLDLNNEEKHEYFDGRAIVMKGAKFAHSSIIANLIGEIGILIKKTEYSIFSSAFRITTPAASGYMYPDVIIVNGDVKLKEGEFDTCTNPSVIIEVMSESTRDRDMGYKFFYYQQIPSLKEYILVDSLNYYAAIIRRQQDDSWKFDTTTDISSSLNIQTIGLSIPLADVYYKVSLH